MTWASEEGFGQITYDMGGEMKDYRSPAAWRSRFLTQGLRDLGGLMAELMKSRR